MSFACRRAYLSKKPCVATGTGRGALLLQQLFAGVCGTFQKFAAIGLDHAGIGKLCQFGVDGALGQHRQMMLCGHLVHMAVAKHIDVLDRKSVV